MAEAMSLSFTEIEAPAEVASFATTAFRNAGLIMVPTRAEGSFLARTAEQIYMVDQLPNNNLIDKTRNLNDLAYTSWRPFLHEHLERRGRYETPEYVAQQDHNEDTLLRAYKFSADWNYLDAALSGNLAENDQALFLLTEFIVNSELPGHIPNIETSMQLLRRPSANDYQTEFNSNVRKWKVAASEALAGLEDGILSAQLAAELNSLVSMAGEFNPAEVGWGGMQGNPNLSRYWHTANDNLLVTSFRKRTSRYIARYGIASSFSYNAMQLGNVEQAQALEINRKMLSMYLTLMVEHDPSYVDGLRPNDAPVFAQRMLGDLFGVLTTHKVDEHGQKLTQESFPVQVDMVYHNLRSHMDLLRSLTRKSE